MKASKTKILPSDPNYLQRPKPVDFTTKTIKRDKTGSVLEM